MSPRFLGTYMGDFSPKSLSLAVIGCGLIGRKRTQALPAGAKLLYACDLDERRARELAGAHKECRFTTNFSVVLQDPAVDAVLICTLNASLAPLAKAAVLAGKHVLVEKPGALCADELREVAALAETHQRVVRVGYNHRFHPALQKARDLIDAGDLGPLLFLRARYGHGGRVGYDREWRADPALSGGGELLDQGVHLIDLSQWFLGELPSVEGHATTSFWDMPVDDNAFLNLRTAAGQTAWLHVSCTEWKNLFSLEIYGRDGKIAIDGLGGSYGVERLAFYRMLPQMGPPDTTIFEYPRGDDSWRAETAAFAADIAAARSSSAHLAQAVRTLEIVGHVYQKSGYKVHASPPLHT